VFAYDQMDCKFRVGDLPYQCESHSQIQFSSCSGTEFTK
jgi:hypothetical protein